MPYNGNLDGQPVSTASKLTSSPSTLLPPTPAFFRASYNFIVSASAGIKALFVVMMGCTVIKVIYVLSFREFTWNPVQNWATRMRIMALKKKKAFLLGQVPCREVYWHVCELNIVLSDQKAILPRQRCRN